MQDIFAAGLGIIWGDIVRIEIGLPVINIAAVIGGIVFAAGFSLIAVVLFSPDD